MASENKGAGVDVPSSVDVWMSERRIAVIESAGDKAESDSVIIRKTA